MLMLAGASFEVPVRDNGPSMNNALLSPDRAIDWAGFRWFLEHKQEFAEQMAKHMTQAAVTRVLRGNDSGLSTTSVARAKGNPAILQFPLAARYGSARRNSISFVLKVRAMVRSIGRNTRQFDEDDYQDKAPTQQSAMVRVFQHDGGNLMRMIHAYAMKGWSAGYVLRDFRSLHKLDSKMKWEAFREVFSIFYARFAETH